MSDQSQPRSKNTMANLKSRGWVSLREFTHIAEISYPTAVRWARLKMIAYVQVGGMKRVYEEEIVRFLREGTLPPDPIASQAEKERREIVRSGMIERGSLKDPLKQT